MRVSEQTLEVVVERHVDDQSWVDARERDSKRRVAMGGTAGVVDKRMRFVERGRRIVSVGSGLEILPGRDEVAGSAR